MKRAITLGIAEHDPPESAASTTDKVNRSSMHVQMTILRVVCASSLLLIPLTASYAAAI